MITGSERSKYSGGVAALLHICKDHIKDGVPSGLVFDHLFHVWMGVCQHLDGQVIKVPTQDETHLGRGHPDHIDSVYEITLQQNTVDFLICPWWMVEYSHFQS